MVDVGPLGRALPCCGADPWHREDCPELLDAPTADDLSWLREHGWQDPRTAPMPTGEAFLRAFYDPRLMSHEWR